MSKIFQNGRFIVLLALLALMVGLSARPALAAPPAHEAPPGSEWVMADWMFLSFAIIAGSAFMAFLFALKAGLLSNLEDAKYYILEIDEIDFYSREWTDEGGEG